MNYRTTALAEIETLAELYPDYSIGQILLAITKRKPEGVSLGEWLYEISDEDLYTVIEDTKLIEAEYLIQ